MANVSSFSGAMPVIPGGEVEVARQSRTSAYATSATTISGASEVFATDISFIADGASTYLLEFCSGSYVVQSNAGGVFEFYLTDGGTTSIARILRIQPSGANEYMPGSVVQFFYTPSAGAVTFNVRGTVNAGTGTAGAGTGSSGTDIPMYLSVKKIVNQNDGLKPFWTPPVVTQLPSQANTGDEVMRYTTNGAYQPHYYTGATDGWKQVGTSKPPLCRVKRSGDLSYTNNAEIAWNAEDYDTDGMHDNSTNNGRITITTAGVYQVNLQVYVTFTGTMTRADAQLFKSGTWMAYDSVTMSRTTDYLMAISGVHSFAAGDYITANINFTGPTSPVIKDDSRTWFAASWLGATT